MEPYSRCLWLIDLLSNEIHVRPSFDLVQQLLWNRESIEVVAPSHFREEMQQTIQRMLDRYNDL